MFHVRYHLTQFCALIPSVIFILRHNALVVEKLKIWWEKLSLVESEMSLQCNRYVVIYFFFLRFTNSKMDKENRRTKIDSGLYKIMLFSCFHMDTHLNILERHRAIFYVRTRKQIRVVFYSIVNNTHIDLKIDSTQDDQNGVVCGP